MRPTVISTALCLIALLPTHAQEAPSCETAHEEATAETTITCSNQPVTVLEQPGESISHAMVATSRSEDNAHALSIVTGSAAPQFTTVDSASVLINDQRHPVDASYTNGEKTVGVAIEQVVVVIPNGIAHAIRSAKTLSLQLNEAVFNLQPAIAQLRRIHELWDTRNPNP